MKFKKVTHVIFDMDGVLLDTETLYTQAISNLTSKYGKEYTFEHKLAMMGSTAQSAAEYLIKALDLPISTQDYIDMLSEQYKILMTNPSLMPGAERLVKHLSKNNIPIAVATSSSRESVALKTQNHQSLFMLFNHLVSGSSDPEVKYSKPAPDIFLVCASRFPQVPKPEEVLVFEDAPNGLMAAIQAGMQCVMVPDPRMPPAKMKGATQVLRSLNEFKPEDFGLPPFPEKIEEKTKKI